MGKVAKDMITGKYCQLCGIYFIEKHGYEVVCKDCWNGLTKEEKKYHQKAIKRER